MGSAQPAASTVQIRPKTVPTLGAPDPADVVTVYVSDQTPPSFSGKGFSAATAVM